MKQIVITQVSNGWKVQGGGKEAVFQDPVELVSYVRTLVVPTELAGEPPKG